MQPEFHTTLSNGFGNAMNAIDFKIVDDLFHLQQAFFVPWGWWIGRILRNKNDFLLITLNSDQICAKLKYMNDF